ncbi:hypothetical protein V8C86DRAFT_451460 [Haematococcus lacustris]
MQGNPKRPTLYLRWGCTCFRELELTAADSLCGCHRVCASCDLRVSVMGLAVYQIVTGLALGCTAIVVFIVAVEAIPSASAERLKINQNASTNAVALGLVIYTAARWLLQLFTGLQGLLLTASKQGILTYSARVIRLARLYLICCWALLLSDLNPLSWNQASWASRSTAGTLGGQRHA